MEQNPKIKFIPDEEIILHQQTEAEKGNDLLNTSTYVDALVQCIKSAPSDKTFTIGLFGEWGSGKSSIVKTALDKIECDAKSNKEIVKCITYDSWKYAGDSFRRMFLYELRKELGCEPSELMARFYAAESRDAKIETTLNGRRLALAICYVFIAILTLIIIGLTLGWKVAIPSGVAFVSLGFSIYNWMFDDLKVSINEPLLFAPEQFEECYHEMLSEAMKRHNWVQKTLKWITRGTYNKEISKLIIVIDNIDRCQPDVTYSLLSDIKSFLGESQDVIFVVPVDIDALRKHIISNNKQNSHDVDEFLRKFFNVSIWIKPYYTDEMFEFADALNDKYGLGLQKKTISVVANEFATNPRRIIQLFNNLTIEKQHYDEYFIRDHEALICQMTIIREEFPNFYKMLQHDATLLFRLENDLLNQDANKRLRLFLQRTYYISKSYEFDLTVVDTVLSNANTSDSLTSQIKQSILTPGSVDEVKLFIGNSEEKRQDVATYILTCIRKALNRGLIEADMINYYPAYLYLVNGGIINESESQVFTNLMQSNELWDKLLPHITDYLPMHIDYSHSLLKKNNQQLVDRYVHYINSLPNDRAYSVEVRNSVFYACNELGAVVSDDLASAFHKAYKEDTISVFAYRYPEPSILFSESLVAEIIEQMDTNNILGNDSPYQQFIQICSQLQPQKDDELIIRFVDRLQTVIPSFEYRNNNKEVLLPFIKTLNSLFGLCKKIRLTETDTLRNVVSRFYARTSGYSLLSVNIEDGLLINSFLDLFEHLCYISNDPIVSMQDITMLISNNQWNKKTVMTLYYLFKSGYDVSTYHESILESSTYSPELIEMFGYMVNDKCPSNRRLVDPEIDLIIKTLIDNITSKSNSEEYSEYLIDFAQAELVESRLISYLQNQKLAILEKLPEKLQRFVVDRFEQYLDRYSNNEPILQLVASCGSKKGIGKLSRLLNQKLSSPGDEDIVWRVLPKLHYLKPSDAKMLSTTIECLDLQHLSDEDKKTYIDIINKIRQD